MVHTMRFATMGDDVEQLSQQEAHAVATKTRSLAKAAGWKTDDPLHLTARALRGVKIETNREQWLTEIATREIVPLITSQGGAEPGPFRVSIGWPKGSRGGKGAESIGQCWPNKLSADKHYEVFISPALEAFQAVEVLIHEMIHVSDQLKSSHKGEFKRLALAVGLEGKMTATIANEELAKRIRAWLVGMPPFPHGALSQADKVGKEKPGSRLLKVSCPSCEYTIRVTQKWLDIAIPHCPNPECGGHEEEMEVAKS